MSYIEQGIKVVSLNAEGDKHLDKIPGFLRAINPDVVMLQESFHRDWHDLARAFGMRFVFSPMRYYPRSWSDPVVNNELGLWGLTTMSKLGFSNVQSFHYVEDRLPFTPIHQSLGTGVADRLRRSLLVTEVNKNGELFRLAHNHFTWTPDAENGTEPSSFQKQDLQILLRFLRQFPDIILCGDFNTPRGKEIFSTLSQVYKDNIPPRVKTTIDGKLHKSGRQIQLVIDGFFTTPGYRVDDVRVIDGVSDHCAIIATVIKNK
ncbi:MAG: endonuclease/exonuclease/phosphatase family protein [bacterium]|nr:endonuclease/exonuclease/phosphatase family protein [bacterium]